MPESLQVSLNDGSVHAVDAPRRFTAEGPFHVEFRNAGGAVHVHLHLDDDLSRVSRIDEVNHYVEADATKRVPIGVLPNRRPVTGRLKVVSGYGAEVAYVDLTIVPNTTGDARAGSGAGSDGPDRSATDRAAADHAGTPRSNAENPTASDAGGTGSNEARSDSGPSVVRRKSRSTNRGAGSATPLAALSNANSGRDVAADTVGSITTALQKARRGSPEAIAFLALAVLALVVALGVIVVVRDVLVALVVLAVVATAVGVAGWVLLR
ncbi:DUF7524 family protein [Halobellus captivus]|uniref:DUF7524 family protein n=1 Tax=Halobellus captivus TaxID=2592614 RepID=UPI0011A47397|nr:hypothetical protein [Halobellus captivus]